MRKWTIRALCLTMILGMTVLSGCGNVFDPELYTRGVLDSFYKNDAAELVRANYDTSENAADNYERFVNAKLYVIADRDELSREEIEEYRSIVEQILASVRYEVGAVQKVSDNSYKVTVRYEPMEYCLKVRESYMEDMQALQVRLMEENPDATDEEIAQKTNKEIYSVLGKNLKEQLETISYGDQEKFEVSIEKVEDSWMINLDDLNELDSKMIDWYNLLE